MNAKPVKKPAKKPPAKKAAKIVVARKAKPKAVAKPVKHRPAKTPPGQLPPVLQRKLEAKLARKAEREAREIEATPLVEEPVTLDEVEEIEDDVPPPAEPEVHEDEDEELEEIVAPPVRSAALLASPLAPARPRPAPSPAKPRPAMPMLQTGAVPEHTMARSYVRNGGAGRGKKRGSTFQCTVSFTEAQMAQVVAAAQYRAVSLAEMIRSCVVEHLNKDL